MNKKIIESMSSSAFCSWLATDMQTANDPMIKNAVIKKLKAADRAFIEDICPLFTDWPYDIQVTLLTSWIEAGLQTETVLMLLDSEVDMAAALPKDTLAKLVFKLKKADRKVLLDNDKVLKKLGHHSTIRVLWAVKDDAEELAYFFSKGIGLKNNCIDVCALEWLDSYYGKPNEAILRVLLQYVDSEVLLTRLKAMATADKNSQMFGSKCIDAISGERLDTDIIQRAMEYKLPVKWVLSLIEKAITADKTILLTIGQSGRTLLEAAQLIEGAYEPFYQSVIDEYTSKVETVGMFSSWSQVTLNMDVPSNTLRY